MKYRILESSDGMFYPQFKDGWLSQWRFFSRSAISCIQSGVPLVRLIMERDPASVAKFSSGGEADDFIASVDRASERYWARRMECDQRASTGVEAKRRIEAGVVGK